MSPRAGLFVVATVGVFALCGVARAQDYSLAPSYGAANLVSGFDPDPYIVAVQAGGAINAVELGAACAGFIADAPDFRLGYAAGAGLPLILSVDSTTDTMLVVNAPDGHWYCDNDGGETGGNPMVRFSAPQSGQYDVWVGVYASGPASPGDLHISEQHSQ